MIKKTKMLQSPTTIRVLDDSKEEYKPPALPLDIWIQIATSLGDLRDVLQLRSVCHDLKNAIEQCHPLWTELDFNACDDINKRKFPPAQKDLVISFLSCLPSQAIKRIKWRPKDSTEAEEILRFVFERFSSIEKLDIRPYLGDATSTYIEVIEQVLNQLTAQKTRCCNLEQLLISHTSFRHERVASFTAETRMIKKIEQHLKNIIGQENESKAESKHHDAAICQDCKKQFAHITGDSTCMVCLSKIPPMCLSCTDYCSLCDSQVCTNCLDEEEPCLDGRCYHGDGEVLQFCQEHEDTNSCELCGFAQCDEHLKTCEASKITGCKVCIDCCTECQLCGKYNCSSTKCVEYHMCSETARSAQN